MKIVINDCHGGFTLSDIATKLYKQKKKITEENFYYGCIVRNDPILIEIVETLGEEANGFGSNLKVVEVPDGIAWYIDDFAGIETIHEEHRTWG